MKYKLLLPILLVALQCTAVNNITTIFKGDGSLIFSETELDITEGALAGNFNITLAAKPTHDVSVSLAVSDDSEIIISPENITFSTDDYDIPRVIIVYGLADCTTDGDQSAKITVTEVTSKDKRFRSSENSYLLSNEVDVTVRDNALNVPELFILSDKSTLQTSESGANDKFLVSLSCAPVANVTINLASSNLAEGVLDTATVNLDSTNYATGQLVTITGQSDCTLEADQAYSISANITLAGLSDPVNDVAYDGLSDSMPVINQNVEMTKQLMISSAGAQVNRGNLSFNNFQVKLSCAPAADFNMNVVVNSLPNGFTLHSPTPNPHTFFSADWAKPVDIINEVTSDLDGAYSITLTPSDVSYPAETVFFADSPTKRVTITTTGLAVGESYEIQNFTDKKDIASNLDSIWWAVNGDPYAFKISRQPNGQVCAIKEIPYGVMSAVMTLTVKCVSGYMVGGRYQSIPAAALDYGLYQGKVSAIASGITNLNRIAVTSNGIFFARNNTTNGSAIYEISAPGTQLVGDYNQLPGLIDSTGTAARFSSLVFDLISDGSNLYVADSNNSAIRKVDVVTKDVITVFNNASYKPITLAIDVNTQTLFFVDNTSDSDIYKLDLATGVLNPVAFVSGLSSPRQMLFLNGFLYVADAGNHRIVKVNSAGAITASWGGTAGFTDGACGSALFKSPWGVATDGYDLYVTEINITSNRLRKIKLDSSGDCSLVSTIAGSGTNADTAGTGVSAQFSQPHGIAIDGRNMYVNTSGGMIAKISNNGLVGYWPLGSAQPGVAGNAKDYSSDTTSTNNLAGTVTSTAATGRYNEVGGAYTFNGTQEVAGTDAGLPEGNAARSNCAWIKPTALPSLGNNNIINSYGTGGINQANGLALHNVANKHKVKYFSWGSDFSVNYTVPIGQWTHICGTFNGTTAKLYVNGHQVGSRPTTWNTILGGVSKIGAQLSAVGNQGFNGSIADVRIYSRVLNEGEINELAQDADEVLVGASYNKSATGLLSHFSFDNVGGTPSLSDSGALNYALTPNGAPVAQTGKDGETGGAYDFDGASQYLFTGSDSGLPEGTHPRTMCAWVKPVRYPGVGGGWFTFMHYGSRATGQQAGISLYDAGKITFDIFNSSVTTEGPPIDTWSHLCAIVDDTAADNISLYVNGKMVHSAQLPGVSTQSGGDLTIGAVTPADLYFPGVIDDVRIYNNALSKGQIRQLATQVPSGLVVRYDFTGDAKDASGWGNAMTTNTASLVADRFFLSSTAYNFRANKSMSRNVFYTGTSQVTFSAWVRWDGTNTGGNQVIIHNGNTGSRGYGIALDSTTGKLSCLQAGGLIYDTPFPLSQNYWNHIVTTISAGIWNVYLNGILVYTGGSTPNTILATDQFMVGKSSISNEEFHGDIDDVRVYNRVLSASEILSLLPESESGNLDTSFGGTGYAIAKDTIGVGADASYRVDINSSDEIAVAGKSAGSGIIWKYLRTGTVDTGFNTTGYRKFATLPGSTNIPYVQGLTFDNNDRIVATGMAATGNSFLLRLTSTGAFDTTFSGDGSVIDGNDHGIFVTVAPSGNIYYSGSGWGTGYDFYLKKYTPGGTISWTKWWSAAGSDGGTGIALDASENSYVVGYLNSGNMNFIIRKYNSSGGLLASKNLDGLAGTANSIDYGNGITLDLNGMVVAVGYSVNAANNKDIVLMRLDPATLAYDTTFNSGGTTPGLIARDGLGGANSHDYAQSVIIDNYNRIVVVGYTTNATSTKSSMFACRYSSNGSIDLSFGNDDGVDDGCTILTDTAGTVSFDKAFSVVMDSQGRIVVSGESNNGIDSDMVLWRLLP